jgi:hypothetical protein
MENKLTTEIINLYALQRLVLNIDHGILDKSKWKLFIPSNFVYAFFSFNTFYNIDWVESIKTKKRVDHNIGEKLELDKIKALIDFLRENTSIENNHKSQFTKILKEQISKDDPNKVNGEYLLKKLENLSDIEGKTDFRKQITNLLIDDHTFNAKFYSKVIYFINKVRNNIFHGTKTSIKMEDDEQIERLKIYTAVLAATNELLFIILEKKLAINLSREYKKFSIKV